MKRIWPAEPIVHHEANTRGGRDLVAGDLHGYFDTLEEALKTLRFDPAHDRLFGVGDLVDRGPRSENAIEWLEQRRIASVRGNHEQMMVNALVLDGGWLHASGASRTWNEFGGWWWYEDWFDQAFESDDARERALERRCARWLDALHNVPFLRTIETPAGRVGIAHTLELTVSWTELEATIQALAERGADAENAHPYYATRDLPEETLWRRPTVERTGRDDTALPEAIDDVALVLTGHTPGAGARWTRANVLCIDTGLDSDELAQLTIAEIDNGTAILHQFARIEVNP